MVFVGGVGHGAEGYADALRNTVDRYDLHATVSFVGEREDASAIMQAADIVLHASTTPEPFGLVVVEGMALGRAVVASGIGGPSEIVTPDSGVLFDPALGEGGRQRASDFSLRQNLESLQALYGALLTGKRFRRA
jgi:glycosyltransferase involved in cell wall biosynthesis